ncbi:TetR/AcrR family transcriptional regulator [Planococcus sp. ISL-109]|uniref:TetR/AcrR family transcriptional regulator n=1 Tax=Planococcus sp. ISL-109 TaxID=2819166 RepID=UPI001BE97600|nr:TetR/AcrR family transcriptional regulator [Planococcus sp. ISL-109]MBT2583444.1 TetR/AcrR family transcriptional regulator [Planococcus sp. ISL-109]
MVTKTLRQQKALETKQRILRTALALFSAKGFDHVSVDEIVRESATSKGAFYGHFASKYDIFLEKFKEIDQFYSEFQQNLPDELPAEDKIRKLAIAQMMYLREELGRDGTRALYAYALTPSVDNYLSDTERPLYAVLESFISAGQKSGELASTASAKRLTMLLSRSMRGTLYDWAIFDGDFDLAAEIDEWLELLFTGLRV